jgi:hypothetical protein
MPLIVPIPPISSFVQSLLGLSDADTFRAALDGFNREAEDYSSAILTTIPATMTSFGAGIDLGTLPAGALVICGWRLNGGTKGGTAGLIEVQLTPTGFSWCSGFSVTATGAIVDCRYFPAGATTKFAGACIGWRTQSSAGAGSIATAWASLGTTTTNAAIVVHARAFSGGGIL